MRGYVLFKVLEDRCVVAGIKIDRLVSEEEGGDDKSTPNKELRRNDV